LLHEAAFAELLKLEAKGQRIKVIHGQTPYFS